MNEHLTPTRRAVATGLVGAAALAAGGLADAEAAPIVVTGPTAGKPELGLGAYDLQPLGYVVEEFFLSGQAQSYKAAGALAQDGRWPVQRDSTAPFTTRLVVVRPDKTSNFNGTVVVEWLNVSGGRDSCPGWTSLHRQILRSGAAYVGVSAQQVGVEGGDSLVPSAQPLKKANPERYRGLSHPGDAFSYDIFTAAGRAAQGIGSSRILGPLTARRLIALGDSQSASFLTTYINAVDPLARLYDGFFVHSRLFSVAGIDGELFGKLRTGAPILARFRTDARAPILNLLTETDVLGFPIPRMPGCWLLRQPDTERLRSWEVPGAAHADTYLLRGGALDAGPETLSKVADAIRPTREIFGMTLDKLPSSCLAHHFVAASAYASLENWVKTGRAPPRAPPIEIAPGAVVQATAIIDANGNAKGGVRTPWLDVPTARYSGVGNRGGPFGFLIGVTEPFDATKLAQLYPGGRSDYLGKLERSLTSAVAAGFILTADAADIRGLAADLYPA